MTAKNFESGRNTVMAGTAAGDGSVIPTVSLASGNVTIGTIDIDQSTPGTTNGVVVNSSVLPTGAASSANQPTLVGNNADAVAATASGNAAVAASLFGWDATNSKFQRLKVNPVVLPTLSSNSLITSSFMLGTNAVQSIDTYVINDVPMDGENSNINRVFTTSLPALFNGTNIDRARSNMDTAALIALAAAGASTVNSPDQTNYNGRGINVVINLTIVTTATVTINLQIKDAASGVYFTVLSSAGLVSAGSTLLSVYPGITTSANSSVSAVLSRTWRVQAVIVGASAAVTGTVGASVIL